jgi:hypothetical protein
MQGTHYRRPFQKVVLINAPLPVRQHKKDASEQLEMVMMFAPFTEQGLPFVSPQVSANHLVAL